MPIYTYRREDGTVFDLRQKFTDDSLTIDPETGQRVVRVMQPTGVIFKGSGFYVNDSKNTTKSTSPAKNGKAETAKGEGNGNGSAAPAASSEGTAAKSESNGSKSEGSTSKSESNGSKSDSSTPAPAAPAATTKSNANAG